MDASRQQPMLEFLEVRRMLSAAGGLAIHYDSLFLRSAATGPSSAIQGYTPSQIAKAYGFKGAATDGAGQTIAVVDAFNDPKLVADLGVFDSQFGLNAPPSLKIVNQTGGSKLPGADSGWAGEISLDVEWAHAMAPGANILLVEATSDSLQDLLTAVDEARHAPGVSVVSMSWGGSEFFSFNGGESASELSDDFHFTTPSGHTGVTFISAAGDSGAQMGVQWPAVSPDVISVGGTSLNLADSSGTYGSEVSWNGTSGGYSLYEPTPAYQQTADTTKFRSGPDVSYDGDPNTGFVVYDSLPDQGYVGWQVVGGTSAGAPQWAALVATADQARAASGLGTLDGTSQTLPALYSLYAGFGTSNDSTYMNAFNDVIDTAATSGGSWHWRWGGRGSHGAHATAGYDLATGLGTPKVSSLIDALAAYRGASGSSSTSTSTGSGSTSSATSLAASPLSATFVGTSPAAAVSGAAGTVKVRITNTTSAHFAGPVAIALDVSTDGSVSSANPLLTSIALPSISLASGGARVVTLKFNYSKNLEAGSYFLVASVTASNTGTVPAAAISAARIAVSAPTVDLSTAFASGAAIQVNPGHEADALVTITNLGNVTAGGTFSLSLLASNDGLLDAGAQLLKALAPREISLRAGRAMTFRVQFVAPADELAGSYSLIASSTSATQPADSNSSNDIAVIATR